VLGFNVQLFAQQEEPVSTKLQSYFALDRIDALWMPDDAFIHSKETLEFVILNTLERNLPFMAVSEVFVKEGALVSLSPSFFSNGQQTAEPAKKILAERISPKNIPVSFHNGPELVLNLKVARKIGLAVPPAILDRAKKVYK
jgi:putative ABC transport system substrate-binding protein